MHKQKNGGQLNILVTIRVDELLAQQIKSIDKSIRLTNVFDLMMVELS